MNLPSIPPTRKDMLMSYETVMDYMQNLKMSDVRRAMPFAGVLLILFGLVRRSPMSVLFAALGGGMVYEGLKNGMSNDSSLYEKGMPTQRTISHDDGIRVEQEVTVRRSPRELYQF